MSGLFICYSSQNKDKVKALVDDIRVLDLEHDVWFNKKLTGGQVWWDKILEKIRECDIIIFALSPESLDRSTACKRKLKYAANLHKTILPILIDDGISIKQLPSTLSKIQLVDYIKQDTKSNLALSKALYHLPKPQPIPDQLPEPPEVPLSYLGKLKEEIVTNRKLSIEKQKVLFLI